MPRSAPLERAPRTRRPSSVAWRCASRCRAASSSAREPSSVEALRNSTAGISGVSRPSELRAPGERSEGARARCYSDRRVGGKGGKTPVLPEYLEVSDTGHHSLLVDVMAAPHHAHDPDGRLWQPCVFHPAHQARAPAGAGAQTRPGLQGGANLRHPLRSAGMRRRAGRQPRRLVELPRGGEPGSRARLGVSEGPAVATGASAAAKKAPATQLSRAGTRGAGPTACRPAS